MPEPLTFSGDEMFIRSSKGTRFGRGTKISGLYLLDVFVPGPDHAHVIKSGGRNWQEWHRALGHLNFWSVKRLFNKKMVKGMKVDNPSKDFPACEACIQAKQHVKPFPQEAETEYTLIGGDDIFGFVGTGPSFGNSWRTILHQFYRWKDEPDNDLLLKGKKMRTYCKE